MTSRCGSRRRNHFGSGSRSNCMTTRMRVASPAILYALASSGAAFEETTQSDRTEKTAQKSTEQTARKISAQQKFARPVESALFTTLCGTLEPSLCSAQPSLRENGHGGD